MTKETHEPDWYLLDPRIRKWMARCATCTTVGVRNGAPAEFFGSKQFEQHFEAPPLNEHGICRVCSEAMEANESVKNRERP